MQLLVSFLIISLNLISFNKVENYQNDLDINILLGTWKLDMSPSDTTDSNYASMEITKVSDNSLEGYFYRKGVEIREGRINTQMGIIYAALVSGDNSGSYNTSFYYKDGILIGTTHAINRNFLSVWTATKEQ